MAAATVSLANLLITRPCEILGACGVSKHLILGNLPVRSKTCHKGTGVSWALVRGGGGNGTMRFGKVQHLSKGDGCVVSAGGGWVPLKQGKLCCVSLYCFADGLLTRQQHVASLVIFMCCIGAAGVISWKECLNNNAAWDTLTWFAALIAMAAYLNKVRGCAGAVCSTGCS
jgi:hypothetical protein